MTFTVAMNTPIAQIFNWTLKGTRILKEMADFRAQTRKVQGKYGTSYAKK